MNEDRKVELKAANENPWYCLATLHGEADADNRDTTIQTKNRVAWNRWGAQSFNEKTMQRLASMDLWRPDELLAYSASEFTVLLRLFENRAGVDAILPDPSEMADFTSTLFDRPVNFSGYIFPSLTAFNSSVFDKSAFFEKTTFLRPSSFIYTEFLTLSMFVMTFFDGDVNFGSSELKYVSFHSAVFSQKSEFINTRFGGPTGFIGSAFKSQVPEFRGASLHEATEWEDVIWPDPPADRELAIAQVYSYQRLKQEMEKLKKHEDELLFFQKELRAKRGTFPKWSTQRCLNWLYDWSSSYGQSVKWPLLWLFLSFCIFALSYAIVGSSACFAWQDAVTLSFSSVFSVLGVKRDFFDAATIAKFSRPLIYISAVQAIVSTVLLFLIALALRNRFRIK